jgi:serine/threonine-protein kinase SRPK3
MARTARKYFNSKGLLKGTRQPKQVPIHTILREDFDIDGEVALEVHNFLTPMLMYIPTRRATAEQVLDAPFLNSYC